MNTANVSNRLMLEAILKIATGSVAKLASDKSDILYSPSNISELEDNTTMLTNIVSIKLKNNLVKN